MCVHCGDMVCGYADVLLRACLAISLSTRFLKNVFNYTCMYICVYVEICAYVHMPVELIGSWGFG